MLFCPCCVQELPFNHLEALSHLYNCLNITMLETVHLYENLQWRRRFVENTGLHKVGY